MQQFNVAFLYGGLFKVLQSYNITASVRLAPRPYIKYSS